MASLWKLLKDLVGLTGFLNPFLEKVLDKALEAGASGAALAYESINQVFTVEAELEKLRETSNRIKLLLKDAEETRYIEDWAVLLWLRQLRDVAFDADDLFDKFQTRVNASNLLQDVASGDRSRKRKRPWCYISDTRSLVAQRWKLSKRITEIRETYDAIAMDKKKLHLKEGDAKRKVQGREEWFPPQAGSLGTEFPLVGLVPERERIYGLLSLDQGDGVWVVSIVGAGGMGKTTLARSVFGDGGVKERFELKIWVSVSRGSDVKKITKEIIEGITGKSCGLESWDLLQQMLANLVTGKKFLLVLDDLCNESQFFWEALRAPLLKGIKGSIVLVTTRSDLVSKNMRISQPVHLVGLNEDDCWLIFRQQAFQGESWNLYPHLELIGRTIIRNCRRSPLAAKFIGGLLHGITDEEEWRSVLSDLPDPEDNANKILLPLKVSYDYLPLHLKQCFTFCSIFPSGYEFDRDELVKLWIAVGFVKPRGVRSVENIGAKYFDYLLWRSFFQISDGNHSRKKKYKMPGLIHELAQSVSSYECLRLDDAAANDEPENARYALSCRRNVDHATYQMIYKHKRIRALIMSAELCVPPVQIPRDLFLNLSCLRALDLSDNKLVLLPDSIGDLILLRYLNLRGTQIERLPESICNLYNLQVLELGECTKLLELPKGMRNLVHLRHLGLHLDWKRDTQSWTDLISMPPGIGRLTSLRTLSRFSISSESGCGIGELKDLPLRGELCISKLENVGNATEAKLAYLKNKRYINAVMLRWSDQSFSNSQSGVEDVIENLCPHTNLRYLRIENYSGTRFPNWLEDPSFLYLESLRLSNCSRCGALPLVGKLPKLKYVYLERLHEVKHMGHVVSSNSSVKNFQSLEELFISDMSNLESWYEVEEGEMPSLKTLVISDCPQLSELFHLTRSLEKLDIRNCPRVLTGPLLPSLQDLVVDGGEVGMFSWINCLTSLSSLTVSRFVHLNAMQGDHFRDLRSLKALKIHGCDTLISLALQDLTNLEYLEISSCQELVSFHGGLPVKINDFRLSFCNKINLLPEGLHLLSFLQYMEIHTVPLVTSLPADGVPASLRRLTITGCPLLQLSCQGNGADRHKVQHIPHLICGC
ncbi:putative disease resistance protein RGA3 [Typha latifolia]|uniref:putative disease resistance protein RGA3 n=1 Tax=Typha latifolia TaxID=4733 RepID=UPI003C2D9C82